MSHRIQIEGNLGNNAQLVKTTSAQARTLLKFSLADNPRSYTTTDGVRHQGEVTWRQCVVAGVLATPHLCEQLTKGRRVMVEGVMGTITPKLMKDAEGHEVARAFQDIVVTRVWFAPELPPRAEGHAPPATGSNEHEQSEEMDELPL